MTQIFLADGQAGQPEVVQEVLTDLKILRRSPHSEKPCSDVEFVTSFTVLYHTKHVVLHSLLNCHLFLIEKDLGAAHK